MNQNSIKAFSVYEEDSSTYNSSNPEFIVFAISWADAKDKFNKSNYYRISQNGWIFSRWIGKGIIDKIKVIK